MNTIIILQIYCILDYCESVTLETVKVILVKYMISINIIYTFKTHLSYPIHIC